MPRVTRKKGIKRNGKKMTKHLNKKRHTLRKKRYFKKYRTRRIKRGGVGTPREEDEDVFGFGFDDEPVIGSLEHKSSYDPHAYHPELFENVYQGWNQKDEANLRQQQLNLANKLKPTSTPFDPGNIKGTPGKSVSVQTPSLIAPFKNKKGTDPSMSFFSIREKNKGIPPPGIKPEVMIYIDPITGKKIEFNVNTFTIG